MVNVLAPRAGIPGLIATLLQWGVQIIDVVSGAGAINKYTVGPVWTGAEFQTINAAVAAAEADGNSTALGGVLISIYPGFYSEAVTIPATLFNWHLEGMGQGQNTGPFMSSLTIAMAPTGTPFCSISGLRVIGATSVTRTAGGGNGQLYIDNVRFQGSFTTSIPSTALETFNAEFSGAVNVTADTFVSQASKEFANTLTVSTVGDSRITAQRLASTVVLSSSAGFSRLLGCDRIAGRITFNGASGLLRGCGVTHVGSPAVTDNTTVSSFCFSNTFDHDAGPAGAVWVKNGAGVFHPGGNDFAEGQLYPWFQINAGTVADPAESDNQIRRVLEVSGSPVLTAAQVGGQRKTTVAKTDGGGTVTLPTVSSAIPTVAGSVELDTTVIVVDLNGNAGGSPYNIAGTGGQTVNGAANYAVTVSREAVELQAVAGGWVIIGRFP